MHSIQVLVVHTATCQNVRLGYAHRQLKMPECIIFCDKAQLKSQIGEIRRWWIMYVKRFRDAGGKQSVSASSNVAAGQPSGHEMVVGTMWTKPRAPITRVQNNCLYLLETSLQKYPIRNKLLWPAIGIISHYVWSSSFHTKGWWASVHSLSKSSINATKTRQLLEHVMDSTTP